MAKSSITIIDPRIDVINHRDRGEQFAITGVLEVASLGKILIPVYQREVLEGKKVKDLRDAFEDGVYIPEIDLGMRGSRTREKDGRVLLFDDIYVIDGLQRLSGARLWAQQGGEPHVRCIVHLDTDESWERKRFEKLNVGQTGLNANVLLRNQAQEFPRRAADVMHRLATGSSGFAMKGKIQWGQKKKRNELISAITYYKVVAAMHRHFKVPQTDPKLLHCAFDKLISKIGVKAFRHNVRTFFQLVDECYGINNIAFSSDAPQIKTNFLMALANIVSKHENFWDGDTMVLPQPVLKQLASFPMHDPTVLTWAGAGSSMIPALEFRMVEHVNRNLRTNKLRARVIQDDCIDADVQDDVEPSEEETD